jgi:hypothetical protein
MAKLKQHSADCVVNLSGEVMVGAGPTLFGFRTVEVSWTDGTNLQRTRLAAPELGCFNLQELVQVKTPGGSFRPSLEMRTVALGTVAPEQELFAPLFNPFRMPAIQRAVPVSIKGRVRGSGSFTVGSQLL